MRSAGRASAACSGRVIVRKLLVYTVSFGLFFPGMIWLLFELSWIENVVRGPLFVLLVLAAAWFPALCAGRGIARAANAGQGIGTRARGGEDRNREAASAGMLTGAGLLLVALCTASWVNHELARRTGSVQATVIGRKHKERGPKSPEEWRLVVRVQGRREDVAVSAAEWQRSTPGTRVSMGMLHGALGFPVLCSAVLRGRCQAEPVVAAGRSITGAGSR